MNRRFVFLFCSYFREQNMDRRALAEFFSAPEIWGASAFCALVALLALAFALGRAGRGGGEVAELTGRLQSLAEILGARQGELARAMTEKLDASSHRVNERLDHATRATLYNLGLLNERLAVIDAAQNRLSDLAREMTGLSAILSDKQARGAFGQGRMEAIVRDALPARSFGFQYQLSTGARPDCVIKLPGDDKLLAIDAKFPLEAFSALERANEPHERKTAQARIRADLSKHIKDISERYLLPGETQDVAIMFVPSESMFAQIHEQFDDMIQKAHRARVLIASPSLFVMAIQLLQAFSRDAALRDEAHVLQAETRKLVEDVERLRQRAQKLDGHYRQGAEDVAAILTSSEKILRAGARIERVDFSRDHAASEAAQ